MLLYEREDKSGGDKSTEHKYYSDSNTLIITYENEEIAKRVIDFGNVTCRNKIYTAKYFNESKKSTLNHQPNDKKSVVIIENVSKNEVDIVMGYFSKENEIEKYEVTENDVLIIYYKTQEIAQSVLNHEPYCRKNKTFKPKVYQMEESKIIGGNFISLLVF